MPGTSPGMTNDRVSHRHKNCPVLADMFSHSRGAMRTGCANRSARQEEGAGNAGCLLHPRSRGPAGDFFPHSLILVKENDDHDAANILALDLDQAERSQCLEIWLHSVAIEFIRCKPGSER